MLKTLQGLIEKDLLFITNLAKRNKLYIANNIVLKAVYIKYLVITF